MQASWFGNAGKNREQGELPTTQAGVAVPAPHYPRPMYAQSSFSKGEDVSPDDASDDEIARAKAGAGMRTPSPTPSEAEALGPKKKMGEKLGARWAYLRENWRAIVFTRQFLIYAIFGIVAVAIVLLFVVFNKQLVTWLQPGVKFLKNLPAGWLIPIAVMIVLSFPPLMGHEIVILLVGLVWGLGIGFGIVAAGTILGELANFYAFRYCCSARGEKLEETNISYACLARIVRDGGIWIPIIARFSAMPGHLTTAVFSTVGMSVWTFLIAATAGLPKQLAFVYFGVALEITLNNKHSIQNTIKIIILGVTMIITFVAFHYLRKKMDAVKPQVVYERRKRRQAKMLAEAYQKDLEAGQPSPSGSSTFGAQATYPVPLHAAPPAYQ